MAIGKGSVNRVTLSRKSRNDPKLARTKSGAAVTTIGLATNEIWKDSDGNKKEHTEWHRVVLWKQLAEIAYELSEKGQQSIY